MGKKTSRPSRTAVAIYLSLDGAQGEGAEGAENRKAYVEGRLRPISLQQKKIICFTQIKVFKEHMCVSLYVSVVAPNCILLFQSIQDLFSVVYTGEHRFTFVVFFFFEFAFRAEDMDQHVDCLSSTYEAIEYSFRTTNSGEKWCTTLI